MPQLKILQATTEGSKILQATTKTQGSQIKFYLSIYLIFFNKYFFKTEALKPILLYHQ